MQANLRSLALATVLLGACGEPGDSAPPTPVADASVSSDAGFAADASLPPAACAETGSGEAFDLTGGWALLVKNAQIFDGSLGEGKVMIETLSWIRATHAAGANEAALETEVCTVELTPYNGNRTVYPAAAVAAIPVRRSGATLSAAEVGAEYLPERRVQLIGWETAGDPLVETVPDDAADPRIIDRDRDGHPGVSLEVDLRADGTKDGEVYVANRSVISLEGRVVSQDCILGSSATDQTQNILDASTALLRLARVSARPDPDPSASTFVMVRAEASSCSELVTRRGELFP